MQLHCTNSWSLRQGLHSKARCSLASKPQVYKSFFVCFFYPSPSIIWSTSCRVRQLEKERRKVSSACIVRRLVDGTCCAKRQVQVFPGKAGNSTSCFHLGQMLSIICNKQERTYSHLLWKKTENVVIFCRKSGFPRTIAGDIEAQWAQAKS